MARNAVDILIRARDEASRQLEQVEARLGRMARSTRRAVQREWAGLSRASAAATTGIVAVGGAAITAATQMVRLAGQLEQSQIAFETMLGSGERADAFLRDLADFAAATPFEFQGLQDSSRLLLAFGFQADAVIPIVETLGDATSALGGGTDTLEGVVRALGQIQTKGRVSTEELLQLAERGVPVFDILREKLNLTSDQVANIGTIGISSSEAITAILEGLGERFGGAMQRQSRTILGLWSTVKDTVSLTAMDLGTQISEALDVSGRLESLVAWLDQLRERVSNLDLKQVFTDGKDAVAVFAGALAGMALPAVINLVRTLVPLLTRIGALALAGALVVDVARQLGVDFGSLAKPGGVLARTAQVFAGLYDIFKAVSTGIAALIRALTISFTDWGEFISALFQSLSGIKDLFLAGYTDEAIARLRTFGDDTKTWWNNAFQGFPQEVEDMFLDANDHATRGWGRLKNAFTGEVEDTFNVFAVTVGDAVDDAGRKVRDWTNLLGGDGTENLLKVKDAAEVTTTAVNDLGDAADAAKSAWVAIGEDIGQAAGSWLRTVLGMDAASNPWVEAGKGIIAGIIAGFDEAFPTFRARVDAALQAGRDAAHRLAPVDTDPLGNIERRRAAHAQAFDESPTMWAPAGGLPPAFDHAAAQAAQAAAAREVQRYLNILNRGLQGGLRAGVATLVDIPAVAAEIAAAAIRAVRQAQRDARVALDVSNQARFGTEAGRDAFMRQVWSDPRGFGPGVPLGITPFATVPAAVPLADPGVFATVPQAVSLTDPGVFTNVTPDRSQLPEEERERILQEELLARQALVEQITQMSTEKGPLGNFGAALLNVAAEQVPALGAALEGFAQGGPMGAVIAFFMELIASSEPVMQAFDAINEAIAPLGELLGRIIAPALKFFARIIGLVVDAIIAVYNATLGLLFGRVERGGGEEPPPPPVHSDRAPAVPEVSFSSVGPAVQLAVATPILEAAQVSLTAAQLQATTAASFADLYGRVEAFYERLMEVGIRARIEVQSSDAGASRVAIVRG